ncbi:molybdate ABC transporter substrate-binding protein [Martelella endophytica]|uniref:Molybdate ABC transporter substrate-binding protein n=1 Tax=Martelella endophytica TaxID=1486262 RepID=A0A0D5LRL3_MAREN|nr:molybdate ABC transporter substrate-binding protein [Martelella endophytica]AJY46781.1 molybdate ABC transporter substrate-binding protein [Martelella endophytica]
MKPMLSLLATSAIILSAGLANAAEINVAVAANFTDAATDIAKAFEAETGDTVLLSFGSTGKLYTQIANGAPFTVFLAADQARAKKAVDEGFAVAGSEFTYAIGKLVLFSEDADLVDADGAVLKAPDGFSKIAIANPTAAPYGSAAVETMKSLGLYETLEPKIVQGDSISQTFQFVATGNAELGFVALSQVIGEDSGSKWVVPADLYSPIAQDAVLTNKGADDETSKAFLEFLKGDKAEAIIASYGYATE